MVRSLFVGVLGAVALSLGCAANSSPPPGPPKVAPTPASITREHPGGDADDPQRAALERLLSEDFGDRYDGYGSLRFALADRTHWQRVRLFAHPTRTALRFGDDHYAIVAVWYEPAKGKDDPDGCLNEFLERGEKEADHYGAQTTRSARMHRTIDARGGARTIAIELVDAAWSTLLSDDAYVGAIVAYPSWPGTCLLQGFAVKALDHRDLAVKVRERWLRDAAGRLAWSRRVTSAPPFEAR